MYSLPQTLLPFLEHDFFMRAVLASIEVMRLLDTRHSLLHESFGIGAGGDCSSGADLLAEAIFCKFFLPHYNIDSEESGFMWAGAKESGKEVKGTIVLDPLDGSSNFKSNIPYYGASLALCDSDGKVCEACVVNYISCELVYLNDSIAKSMKMPCVFRLQAFIANSFLDSDSLHNNGKACYSPNDFARLFKDKDSMEKHSLLAFLCEEITRTTTKVPHCNAELLNTLLTSKLLVFQLQDYFTQEHLKQDSHLESHSMQTDVRKQLECGIFEKVAQCHQWVEFLTQHNLKFRSLGATALSLAFSFRYLFVLLPAEVRKYDGMAGFYLAQNQIIYGNTKSYCHAIPTLRQGSHAVEYVIVTADSAIMNTFIGR